MTIEPQLSWLDRPRAVRAEDGFDVSVVDTWLRDHLRDLPPGLPNVLQFSKGASNLTYKLIYPNRSLILRRPPQGQKAASAHNMPREYRIQQKLAGSGVEVPAMLALCIDKSIIGSEFYVMEHVEGIILRANLPVGMQLSSKKTRELSEAAVDQLIALHQVNIHHHGLADIGKGEGYNRRQIDGWAERFRRAKTWNVPSGSGVISWLSEHCPPEVSHCLVHGDFRFDNLVLEEKFYKDSQAIEIKALLDWELATIGDPLMDLGNAMAYWVQGDDDFYFRGFRRQPTHLEGMMTRHQVVDYYCKATGLEVETWAFYEVYGLFRLAAIVQQIYFRYHHKQTRNPQFKHFWVAVHYLIWRCERIIRQRS